MNRKVIIPVLLLMVLSIGVSCSSPEQLMHPNVLFIICDDLNDYSTTFDGHPDIKTPNIDKLAQSSTIFLNAHTNVGLCQPSRNSLFCGIYPHTSKDFGWTPHHKNPLLKNNKTFVEMFGENGYYVLGTGKLQHHENESIWDEWGVERRINYGPHAHNGKEIVGHPSVPEAFRKINNVDGSFAPLSDIPVFDDVESGLESGWSYGPRPFRYVNDSDRDLMPDEMHANWAVEKIKELEQREGDQPFFLGVGFVKPHTPLYAPQKYFDMFPLDEIEVPAWLEEDAEDCFYTSVYPDSDVGLYYFQALKEAYPEGDIGLKKFMQAYMACVAFVDDQVGVVVDALDKSKFKDNTIVILTSDHGWQMGQKDYLYKNSPWEAGTRIPLLVRDPYHSKPGSEVRHPVSLIDIYPTLMDLCSLEGSTVKDASKNVLEGFSLRTLIENPRSKKWVGPKGALTLLGASINTPVEGVGVSSNPKALWHIQIKGELPDSLVMQQNYSYRTQDWRYIMYRNGKEELYDHSSDHEEWYNLSSDEEYDEVRTKMKADLIKMINN
jgi:arylsulfatase A-like enzyme